MSRIWLQGFTLMLLILALTGCSASPEEQITNGIQLTEKVFAEKPESHTDSVDDVQLYLPSKFDITDRSDSHNIVMDKGKQSFILFINKNEQIDSELYYDLLKKDDKKEIIEEKVYDKKGIFGFSAVIKTEKEDEYELIVSCGGVKMSTISPAKKVEDNLHDMTKIVRSVKLGK
ncbi:MAG: hypothetical protein RR595_08470 [Lysinibacillus sp.]